MANNFLSAFAIVTVIGFSAALLPRLAAPSDSYFSESLEPTEEPFYITVNPENLTLSVGERSLLVSRSNLTDVSYAWQVLSPGSSSWSTPLTTGLVDGAFPVRYTTPDRYYYYRCLISHGDRTIYSAPCLVVVSSSDLNSKFVNSDIMSDNYEFENDAEFEESEKVEVFVENERGVENAE